MYNSFQKTIAYLLLGSHLLMSCGNPAVDKHKKEVLPSLNKELPKPKADTTSSKADPIDKRSSPILPNSSGPAAAKTDFPIAPLASKKDVPIEGSTSIGSKDASRHKFITREGHEVSFVEELKQAIVSEKVASPFSRQLTLPVKLQDASLTIDKLLSYSQSWHKMHIHICWPEEDLTGKGYVYIGDDYRGLLGGMRRQATNKSPKQDKQEDKEEKVGVIDGFDWSGACTKDEEAYKKLLKEHQKNYPDSKLNIVTGKPYTIKELYDHAKNSTCYCASCYGRSMEAQNRSGIAEVTSFMVREQTTVSSSGYLPNIPYSGPMAPVYSPFPVGALGKRIPPCVPGMPIYMGSSPAVPTPSIMISPTTVPVPQRVPTMIFRTEPPSTGQQVASSAIAFGANILQIFIEANKEDKKRQREQEENDRLFAQRLEESDARFNQIMAEAKEEAAREKAERKAKLRLEEAETEAKARQREKETLESLLHTRLACEAEGISLKNNNPFISSYSEICVEGIQECLDFLKDLNRNQLLEEREIIRTTIQDIRDVNIEILEGLSRVAYGIKYPNNLRNVRHTIEDLRKAIELLEKLQKQKEEIVDILIAKGERIIDYEEEVKSETEEETTLVKELTECFNDVKNVEPTVAKSIQEMQALLDQVVANKNKRQELQPQATELASRVEKETTVLRAQKHALQDLYFRAHNLNAYANRPIAEGIKKLQFITGGIFSLEKSLSYFSKKMHISWSGDRFPYSVIQEQDIRRNCEAVAKELVSGSNLAKQKLQGKLLPVTTAAWAEIGAEVGYDYMPDGQTMRLLAVAKPESVNLLKKLLQKLLERKKAAITKTQPSTSQLLTLDNIGTEIEKYIKTIERDRKLSLYQKEQGKVLLAEVETIKQQEKTAYRHTYQLSVFEDIDGAIRKLIDEEGQEHKANADRMRELRKTLKASCQFSKEDLRLCKVKTKETQTKSGYTIDSSDEEEEPFSRGNLALKLGAMKGLMVACQKAPMDVITGLVSVLENPLASVESIIAFIELMPELPGLIGEYVESIEGNEEEKGKEIGEFIGRVVLSAASPGTVKLLRKFSTLSKNKLALAATKVARTGKLWQLTDKVAVSIKLHKGRYGKIFKSKSDGLWWAIDQDNHGGSKFKVFKETSKGLDWFKDADEYGKFILNKHKGPKGLFIPWGELTTIK